MIRWKQDGKVWDITCQHCSHPTEKHGNYRSLVVYMQHARCGLGGEVFLSKEDAQASLCAAQLGTTGDGIAILWNIVKEARARRDASADMP